MTFNAYSTPSSHSLQVDSQNNLRHFLTIEGLPRELLIAILELADKYVEQKAHLSKKISPLANKTVANLFFETSTRTRSTFELAAKRLGADVLNLNISTSSTGKGETLLDTVYNLEAMGSDIFVLRHAESGAAHLVAQHVQPHVAVINAGDGRHAHPTQAMLDIMTIRHHKKDLSQLSIAIVGDIAHSRVARSAIHALTTLRAGEIRVVAPKTLLPTDIENLGVKVHYDLASGIRDTDVVMMLRLQRERMQTAYIPSEQEFYRLYGLTTEKLAWAKPDALVMHPGPTNRGVEIESAIIDSSASVILEQVTYGIAVRMAIMTMVMQTRHALEKLL